MGIELQLFYIELGLTLIKFDTLEHKSPWSVGIGLTFWTHMESSYLELGALDNELNEEILDEPDK